VHKPKDPLKYFCTILESQVTMSVLLVCPAGA